MKNLGNLNNWTKLDLSRVIVQALMNLDKAANSDNPEVVRMTRSKKAHLVNQATSAIEIINQNKMANLK